ncbi:hypothetical protein [Nocardia salmonicida]|uniref:hypothetical protein n=1 Tax=Nocardia salmonicida TaxID=53431 RepID=UPI000A99B8E8|nr:hypothetical protein [Nocardia salmonicida]
MTTTDTTRPSAIHRGSPRRKLADSFLDIRFYRADVAIITSRGDRYDKNIFSSSTRRPSRRPNDDRESSCASGQQVRG